jgi:hypothetical protein
MKTILQRVSQAGVTGGGKMHRTMGNSQSGLKAPSPKPLLWVILAFAVLVRVLSYTSDRSLWIDEAMLSLNIIQASFQQLLLHPMQYFQVAPLGFLAVEKTLVSAFGDGEMVLRLFPFLCSILSVWLFYRLSRNTGLGSVALLTALGAIAASRGLVYYAGEVKQYASDTLITISLLLLAHRVLKQPKRIKSWLWLGLAGVLAVWFAYPAIFVLLGLSVALIVICWRQNQRLGVGLALLCLLAWAGSMGLYYAVGLEAIRASSAHQTIWRDVWDQQMAAFLPSLTNPQGWLWLFNRTVDVFKFPVGNQVQQLAALLFFVGLGGMIFARNQTNRAALWLTAAPIAVTLLASALHLYPYTGRLVLFLVPSYLLVMAAGIDLIEASIRHSDLRNALRTAQVIASLLGLTLVVPSVFTAKLYRPLNEELKPVLSHIETNQQAQDRVLVYYGAQPAMAYYGSRYKLPPLLGADYQDYLNGMERRNHPDETRRYLNTQLAMLQQQSLRTKQPTRFWFVVSHQHGPEVELYRQVFNEKGAILLNSFNSKGTRAELFQLQP